VFITKRSSPALTRLSTLISEPSVTKNNAGVQQFDMRSAICLQSTSKPRPATTVHNAYFCLAIRHWQ